MDTMASAALRMLAQLFVPTSMVCAAYVMCPDDWLGCGIVIAGLSFMVTNLAVNVYDVCVTSLFLCMMRDLDKYNGIYMPEDLATVAGVSKSSEATGERGSIEMC
eukprot:gnl/TRDRNA2_/TRDRNA2_142150_c0_seq1.p1 gnl/TRDRNA2_/TRDRNA2_142150_c0~~gnl/TRDRNA2_/TRDRNA2_142150_c0_seq1.p1  ORF type:complete len:105 (+),score=13.98 gnl/TRDRNA2_/TRDRNA2_142150_c0_seq1:49-363(+)